MNNEQSYGMSGNAAAFCLGQPSHALQVGDIMCRVCGTLAMGAQIGIYRVQKFLGSGRGGRTYLAVHQRSGQPAVVKLTAPDTQNKELLNLWEAARREVRVVSTLRHPSILPVFSCAPWHSQLRAGASVSLRDLALTSLSADLYLLTLCQYVPGTLTHFIAHYQKHETQIALYERGISPVMLVLSLLQQAGAALSAAHARGIAHGAIVPGNILLAGNDRVWVADFGLAKLQPPPAPYLPPELYVASSAYSQSGNISAYWNAVNAMSDQYMFAMLSQQILTQVLPASEHGRWQPVLQRAMQPRPERRYPTLDLFVADLLAVANRAGISQSGGQHAISSRQPAAAGARGGGSGSQWQGGSGDRFVPTMSPVTPALPFSNPGFALPVTPPPSEPMTPPPALTPMSPQSPLDAEGWEKRGGKLFTMRDYEGALTAYHRALELVQNRASIWLALGDTYFALERYKEALMAYEQAMYLNPDDPQSWSNRGTALDALGRHKEALDCYERAEQLQ